MVAQHVVLFAHGSSDPLWSAAIESLRNEMATRTQSVIKVAYMERCQPTLVEVVDELYAQGVRNILVLPLFLAPGGHMTNDVIPGIEALKGRFKGLCIETRGALLESHRIRDAIIADLL